MPELSKAVYLEPAPAKINLFLNVKNKRPDSFHNIETLFQAIDLMDHLTFEITVKCEDSEEVDFEILIDSNNDHVKMLGEDNIIAKAIELYFASLPDAIVDKLSGVHISVFVDKNIPIEAGLAGGSSNAAATLRVLNKFFHENFSFAHSNEILQKIALNLGSDVPFCLLSTNSSQLYAESRGEAFVAPEDSVNKDLLDFDFDKYNQLIIVKPSFGISTREAYELVDKVAEQQAKRGFFNSFEAALASSYPELDTLKQKLITLGCDHVLLSGSGSTMLGFVAKDRDIDDVFLDAKKHFTELDLITKSSFLT